jgi:hypothetical protein
MNLNQLPQPVLAQFLLLQEQAEHLAQRAVEIERRLDYCRQVNRGDIRVNQNQPFEAIQQEARAIKKEAVDLEPQLRAVHGRINGTRAVLSSVRAWIDALPADTVFEQVAPTSTRGETLQSVRDHIEEIEAEIKALRGAPLPSPDLRARVEAYVESLGAPVVSGIEAGQQLEVRWPDPVLLVAALMPERLVERVFDAAQRSASELLPPEERPARIDELERDLERLSLMEEALVVAAIEHGDDVCRRYGAPPAAILSVRIKEDARRGTRRERRVEAAA